MLSAQQVREEPGVYKYVQMADGSFRFALAIDHDHIDLVEKGEVAISAGNILVDHRKKFRYLKYGSVTLDLSRVEDKTALERALGIPGEYKEE
jgi:hypothetical protein